MSARDRVRLHLGLALSDPADAECLLQAALDEHARELAGRLRGVARRLPGEESELEWLLAADLIEPVVEQ